MKELSLPKLSGKTEKEQLEELKSYLYKLVQELNYRLRQLEKEGKQ